MRLGTLALLGVGAYAAYRAATIDQLVKRLDISYAVKPPKVSFPTVTFPVEITLINPTPGFIQFREPFVRVYASEQAYKDQTPIARTLGIGQNQRLAPRASVNFTVPVVWNYADISQLPDAVALFWKLLERQPLELGIEVITEIAGALPVQKFSMYRFFQKA